MFREITLSIAAAIPFANEQIVFDMSQLTLELPMTKVFTELKCEKQEKFSNTIKKTQASIHILYWKSKVLL